MKFLLLVFLTAFGLDHFIESLGVDRDNPLLKIHDLDRTNLRPCVFLSVALL
jgi:hypothetical protein